jgi:hypothetical protein
MAVSCGCQCESHCTLTCRTYGNHVRTGAPWALCPNAVADLACGILEHLQLHVFAATVQLPAFVAVPPIPDDHVRAYFDLLTPRLPDECPEWWPERVFKTVR